MNVTQLTTSRTHAVIILTPRYFPFSFRSCFFLKMKPAGQDQGQHSPFCSCYFCLYDLGLQLTLQCCLEKRKPSLEMCKSHPDRSVLDSVLCSQQDLRKAEHQSGIQGSRERRLHLSWQGPQCYKRRLWTSVDHNHASQNSPSQAKVVIAIITSKWPRGVCILSQGVLYTLTTLKRLLKKQLKNNRKSVNR